MNREFEPATIERREPEQKYSLSLEDVKKIAREGAVIPIYRTMPADLDTPFSAYLKVRGEGKESEGRPLLGPSMLLEGVAGGENVARYSYICTNPKEGIRVTANEITTANRDGTVNTKSGERIDPLDVIKDKVSKTVVKGKDVPPFSGGYVGYLGYEVSSAFEKKIPKSNPDVLGVPEAMLFNFDQIVAYDRARSEMKVIGNIEVEDIKDLDRQYQEATSRIDAIVDRITHTPIRIKTKTDEEETRAGEIRSNFSQEDYMDVVRKLKEDHIVAGDVIQVVSSRRLAVETKAHPLNIYSALRSINPSPFMVYFDMGNFQIIGASPELLLKVENGEVSTWPIAGTRARGKTSEEDAKLEEELKANEKEKAEHVMLVDLGRNDVGRVSETGTVKVTEFMAVKKYSNVMHLGSEVKGKLRKNLTSLDALRAIFPAGTVSGAPKIMAQELIDKYETEQRGPYAGSIGYIDYSGNMEQAITIRTIVYKDGIAYVQVGGGIVYDSDPQGEYQETIDKSQGSIRAIRFAEGKL